MKPSIISRYVLRAWLGNLLGALLLFGGLLLIHETVGVTRELLAEKASFKWLPVFLLLALPEVLSLVLPMASIFAGLLGTQSLAQGSELVAAQGLGTGARVFYRPWILMGLGLVALGTFNAHGLVPMSHRVHAAVREQLAEEAKQRFLRPGAPPTSIPGDHPQALWTSPAGQVHILDVQPKGIQHLVSDQVSWSWKPLDEERSTLQLRLDQVSGSYLPRDGKSAVQLRQASQSIEFPIKISTHRNAAAHYRTATTPQLLRLDGADARAELARRISLPFLAGALLLVGIALGYGHPRFQSGSGLMKGLGVLVLYFIAHRLLEARVSSENNFILCMLIMLPFILLLLGMGLLRLRMKPHKALGLRLPNPADFLKRLAAARMPDLDWPDRHDAATAGILGRWSRRLWVRSWGGVLATLILLHLLIEYSSLAGDLAAHGRPLWEFFIYWFWRLPIFLVTALPMAFMLGTVLAISTATLSHEWVALRTGGLSLWAWIWSARRAWLGVLGATFLLHQFVVPAGEVRSQAMLQRMLERRPGAGVTSRWQFLGATGVLWYMEPQVRWGFPLKSPGAAPALLTWTPGAAHSAGLPWDAFNLRQGPATGDLFPEASLLSTPVADESSTLNLIRWQRWAYDNARASHLWVRFLAWLAGPCLVFAVLPRAFPNPRQGRGGAVAQALVMGLLFLGLQLLFRGIAASGEIPAVWGVLGPLLMALAAGSLQMRHLRT